MFMLFFYFSSTNGVNREWRMFFMLGHCEVRDSSDICASTFDFLTTTHTTSQRVLRTYAWNSNDSSDVLFIDVYILPLVQLASWHTQTHTQTLLTNVWFKRNSFTTGIHLFFVLIFHPMSVSFEFFLSERT